MLINDEAAEIAQLSSDLNIPAPKPKANVYMGLKDVAKYTGFCKSTLDKLHHFGGGPR